MKKIIYIVSTLKRSGPTNQLYNIIKYLDKNEFEPHLITLSPEPKDSRWNDYETLGVNLYSLGLSRLQGFFSAKTKLKSLIFQINPDIIHTQGIRADVLSLKFIKSHIVICTARNYPYHDYPSKFGFIRGILMAYKHIAVLKKIKVVSCSRSIQDQLFQRGINSLVVQNGVDILNYKPLDNYEKLDFRRKVGIPEDSFIFITVGSLILRKDVQTIINAFNNANHVNKVHLLILGDGYQLDLLKNIVNNDFVNFIGNVNNVAEYLQASDVFISSSLSEGLPNTVLEAMACGLPCLLSDISSHNEIVEEAEWKFLCKDYMKLASLMERIEKIDISILRANARERIEENFDSRKMSEHYQNIYYKLLVDA